MEPENEFGNFTISSPQIEDRAFGFDSEERAKSITPQLLRQSIRVEGKFGKQLPTRPVQFWDVIDNLQEKLVQENINFTPDPVYVQAKNSHLMLVDKEKGIFTKENAPIEKWLFDKLVGRLHIPNLATEDANAAIAVAYNEEGIRISFGLNVRVCSNMAIMGGHILQTFSSNGRERDSYQGMLAQFESWLRNLEQIAKVEFDVMRNMQQHQLPERNYIDLLVGKLYTAAINQAYGTKEAAPFNTDNMSVFTQALVKKDGLYNRLTENPATVWDLYNIGTSIMKPGLMDLQDIHNSSALLSNFLVSEFNLN